MKRLILLTLILILLIGCAPKPKVEVAPIVAPQPTIVKEQPPTTQTEPTKIEEQVKEITVVAKQFSFDPDPIVVNKGDKVKLILRSADVTHGFAIIEYGINKRFSKEDPAIVEFTADKAGEFKIFCSVFCGSGHSAMIGKLIVQ